MLGLVMCLETLHVLIHLILPRTLDIFPIWYMINQDSETLADCHKATQLIIVNTGVKTWICLAHAQLNVIAYEMKTFCNMKWCTNVKYYDYYCYELLK